MAGEKPETTTETKEVSPTIATLLAKIDEMSAKLVKLEADNKELVEFNRTLINRGSTGATTEPASDESALTPDEQKQIEVFIKGE